MANVRNMLESSKDIVKLFEKNIPELSMRYQYCDYSEEVMLYLAAKRYLEVWGSSNKH